MMERTKLLDGYKVERMLPLNYHDISEKEQFIKQNYSFGNMYLCTIMNAYISPYGLVLKNWQIVKESVYSMIRLNASLLFTFIKKIFLRKVRVVGSTCVVAIDGFYNNYYHFAAESLPRLFMLKDLGEEVQVLVHENMPGFIRQYAQLLGYKNLLPVKDDELILARKVLLPSHSAHGLCHNETLMQSMAAFLKKKVEKEMDKFKDFKNIYVSRQKALYRKLLNEEELLKLLQLHEFQVINFEDYTVSEQIALMSKVKNCIAVHGAGLTNIMYMEKGGLVINLIHEEHYDQAFFSLASAAEQRFILMQGRAANEDARGFAFDNFSIDLEKLEEYLTRYLT